MKVKSIASKNTKHSIQALFLSGMLISFLGWVWEMACAALILQNPNDRGFLILPFCPIYGFSVITIYLLFRTPKDMRLMGKDIFKFHPAPRYILYFLLAGFFATLFEFLTGFFFDHFFDVRLWNYKDFFGSIFGYVALFPALGWGIAITVFMRLVFHPLYHFVKERSHKTLNVFFWLFFIPLLADPIFNFSYLFITGKWFNFNHWFS